VRRSTEVPLFVAVSALTLTTTVAAFTDSAAPAAVTSHLSAAGQSVAHWLAAHRLSVRPHTMEPAKGVSQLGAKQASADAQATQAAQTETLSQADMTRLSKIVEGLLHSLTPDDWRRLGAAVTSDNDVKAQQSFANVLGSHLSSADKQWLNQHFHGRTAFDAEDVRLLQTAFAEMKQELTPAEQHMLMEQLGSWLSK
jgi:hypothetical protein